MILIDANALVLLIVGLVDQNLIPKHKRTSLYSKKDYDNLLIAIGNFDNLVVLPNIWTEVDNLLNRFSGNYKWLYIQRVKALVTETTEEFLTSAIGINSDYFIEIGLTDSLILELRGKYDVLITGDSGLSDIARAHGIDVYDLVEERNKDFR